MLQLSHAKCLIHWQKWSPHLNIPHYALKRENHTSQSYSGNQIDTIQPINMFSLLSVHLSYRPVALSQIAPNLHMSFRVDLRPRKTEPEGEQQSSRTAWMTRYVRRILFAQLIRINSFRLCTFILLVSKISTWSNYIGTARTDRCDNGKYGRWKDTQLASLTVRCVQLFVWSRRRQESSGFRRWIRERSELLKFKCAE